MDNIILSLVSSEMFQYYALLKSNNTCPAKPYLHKININVSFLCCRREEFQDVFTGTRKVSESETYSSSVMINQGI